MNISKLRFLEWRGQLHRLLIVLGLVIMATVPSPTALAHGGGTPQLTNEDIGPYWISVWTSPNPAREGQLHVTVSIAEPGEGGEQQAGAPVLGAAVELILIPPSGTMDAISARATNEQSANKLYYEADVHIPVAGDWLVQIDVQGAEGSGQAQFELTVEPAQDNGWLLPGGAAFLVIAAFFFYYAARRRSHG